MQIPDAKIQEVRERADLIALMQRHGVDLKKAGRSYKGLCPFHGEKSPSFNVWPDDGHFYCFGCQASGDAISFVQRLLGKPFLETVLDLAKELGIEIEAEVDPAMVERQHVKEATDFAARHFVERLWDPNIGRPARDYLHSRGLTDDLIRAFGLGWAPLAWTELADKLREHGFLSFGEKAGLVSPRQRADGYFDLFRGRVIIPIRSPEGRTIAFGGRLLVGDDGPKYLNSRENRLYNKSEVLYATDQARDEVRKRKSAVLCEGYFDAIGMHQAGIKNAVALCSTALTSGHLTLLSKLEAKELVLLLDGDEAGRKAVERLAGTLLANGSNCRVAVLPEGEDPDTFARKAGPEGVQRLLQDAKPLTTHIFQTFLPDGPISTFEEKMAALERFRPILAMLPVGLARSALFGSMAKWFDLPSQELELALKGKPPPAIKSQPKTARITNRDTLMELKWCALVAHRQSLLAHDELQARHELKEPAIRSLVGAIHGGATIEDAIFDASDEIKNELSHMREQLNMMTEESLEAAFRSKSKDLKLRAIEDRSAAVRKELDSTPGSKSDLTPRSTALLTELSELQALKQRLKSQK